jgi:hypothetical protein
MEHNTTNEVNTNTMIPTTYAFKGYLRGWMLDIEGVDVEGIINNHKDTLKAKINTELEDIGVLKSSLPYG